jgi:hypothetical protein
MRDRIARIGRVRPTNRSSEQLTPALHFRESPALSIAQAAERLGRSPATVNACFYDPTGEKPRAVKARYPGGVGVSLSSGDATRARRVVPRAVYGRTR